MSFVPDVAGKRCRAAAGCLDFGDERVQLSLAARRDDEPGALFGKQFGGGAADAGAGAGDDSDLACECEHFPHPFSVPLAGGRMLGRKLGFRQPPES